MRIRQNVCESALHLPFIAGRVHYFFPPTGPVQLRTKVKDTEGINWRENRVVKRA